MKTLSDDMHSKNLENETYTDINTLLLNHDKKVVSFLGTSKSGTSFILNNIAEFLSTRGVNVAILDTTQNRNTYYIYTKNEESLRNIALESTEHLIEGQARGVKVNTNLTVYTALPGENKQIQKVEPILETLLKNHSLILIDCDFKTPINYFDYAQEIYLVQTMDVLTIQPVTEFLLVLKNKGILQDSKLRIILNKYVQIKGISEREIISGMAFYNDPSMAYMKELFNKNSIQYMTIPYEEATYVRYLEAVAICDINLNGYPSSFIQILEQLSDEIYPFRNIPKDNI